MLALIVGLGLLALLLVLKVCGVVTRWSTVFLVPVLAVLVVNYLNRNRPTQ